MTSWALCVLVLASAAIAAPKPRIRLTEQETVERWLVEVRLDPKSGATPGECNDLSVSDLAITVEGFPAMPTSVERVPRPERHWLLVDTSSSVEARRQEAKRSAAQYVREVMMPGVDSATVLTVDQDTILVAGPSTNPSELTPAIEGVLPGWSSALMDGLDTVLRQIQGDPHEHLVLYWTDGQDTASIIPWPNLLADLTRAPNATIFAIGVDRGRVTAPGELKTEVKFGEAVEISGGEVFNSSDPLWLDRVRGWIGRRFNVGFALSLGTGLDRPRREAIKIKVREKRCKATVLPNHFPEDAPTDVPPAAPSLVELRRDPRPADGLPCAIASAQAPWESPFRVERDELRGCVVDVVKSPGARVVESRGTLKTVAGLAHVVSRSVRVIAPELSRLPTDLAEVIEAVTPDDWNTPAPFLMEGDALLGQRTRIATSVFAARADYRDFALNRLRRFAEDDVRAIERDLARTFPNLPADQIEAAARASRAGQRAIKSAQSPNDTDIARVLAAWIRDISAAEMLRDLERRFIDIRIRKGTLDDMVERWSRIRERFSIPSRTRITAPLALIRDPKQDLVGFVRVVFPRPEWFFPAEPSHHSDAIPIDPRLPRLPLALLLVDALARRPGVGAALAARGYHAIELSCTPKEPSRKADPGRPYVYARVLLTLGAESVAGGAARVKFDAAFDVGFRGDAKIVRFKPSVTGDPALAALLTN